MMYDDNFYVCPELLGKRYAKKLAKNVTSVQEIPIFEISKPPRQIGFYQWEDFRIFLTKKPNWFRRLCSKLFLGLVWVDMNYDKH